MKVMISGHHYELSETTRDYIEAESAKLERFYTPILGCQVTIAKEERMEKADVVVSLHGQSLKSSDESDKLYPAIDGAIDKMIRQLKKVHDKRRKPRPGPAQTGMEPVE